MGHYCCCCMKEDLVIPISSIYEIKMNDIDGQLVDFEEFRGKVLLIVNVACK